MKKILFALAVCIFALSAGVLAYTSTTTPSPEEEKLLYAPFRDKVVSEDIDKYDEIYQSGKTPKLKAVSEDTPWRYRVIGAVEDELPGGKAPEGYVITNFGLQKDDPAAGETGGEPIITPGPPKQNPKSIYPNGYPYGASVAIIKEDIEKFDAILRAGKKPKLEEVPIRPDYTHLKVVGVEEE